MISARSAPGCAGSCSNTSSPERNLARNTQQSYRDTFALLLPFVGTKARKPVDRLAVDDLTPRRVLQFLAHIEEDRGCSVQTRNQRLTAIRACARFVASRDPGYLEWSANIRSIALKKATPQPIGWLSKEEMKALLEVPDRRTQRGRMEHALLLFLYNTGARVSEATDLTAGDLQIGRRDGGHALVTIPRQGRKAPPVPALAADRTCPFRTGAEAGAWRRRLPQPAAETVYTVRGLSACRALRGACAGARREEDHASHDPPYERLSLASGRGRPEYNPRLAGSCEPRYHQHLRRDRS